MLEFSLVAVMVYAGVAGWAWWLAPMIGAVAGVAACRRRAWPEMLATFPWIAPNYFANAVITLFGWASLSSTFYLFARIITRGRA